MRIQVLRWAAALTLAGLAFAPPASARQLTGVVTLGELLGDTAGKEGEILTFSIFVDGPDAATLDFSWDFGDGRTLVGPGLSGVAHEFLKGDSTYTVTVSVSGAGSRSLDVFVRNGEPRILTLAVEPHPRLERPVEFWAEAEDPGADELEYEWDFGDGSPPQTGTDLREVTHPYAESGRYEVTLTVRDEASEVTRTISVPVGLDLVADMTGGVAASLEGKTGPGSLPAFFLAAGIPRHSIGRLSEEQCLVALGFWDDSNRIQVTFLWAPLPGEVFEPVGYRVADARTVLTPGAVIMTIQVLRGADSYARAWRDAVTAEANISIVAAAGRTVLNLIEFIRTMPMENAMLFSTGGDFHITRASDAAISGEFAIELHGVAYRGHEIGGAIEGRFTWQPMIEETRTSLKEFCHEEQPFRVTAHTPEVEKKGVDFVSPAIEITFSERYKADTVTDENIEVGYMNDSNEFEPIKGRLTLDTEELKVWFYPDDPLMSGVYYHVRIRSGPDGVLSLGEEELADDYEWRFLTTLRAVPISRGQEHGG